MASSEFTTEELQSEEWRDIPGYDGRYQVSNLGRVRSVTITILKPCRSRNPAYRRVSLYKNRQGSIGMIHQLVANAFLGPQPTGMIPNHKDTNKLNNRASNLEYLTPKGNAQHASENGLLLKGEEIASSKLTERQVRAILHLLGEGHSTYSIARRFNVTATLISLIKRGKAWKHIERPSSPRLGQLQYPGPPQGTDSPNAKINEATVKQLRHLYSSGDFTMKELAIMFNIGKSQTKRIIDKRSWKHVE